MLIQCVQSRLRTVNELIDTGNELDALTVGLFQDGFVPSAGDVLADLTAVIATFSGYVAHAPLVWEGAYMDANNTAYVLGGLVTIEAAAASPFVSNLIGGYYLFAGGLLRGSERFTDADGLPTPVSVSNQYGVVAFAPRYSYAQ